MDALPKSAIFKIVDQKTVVFCSSGFKDAVEGAGLKGLSFREVWNDDGDEIEASSLLWFLQ